MGHYLASRAWKVRATLPYFIPFPSLIGTMGAVIKIKSRIPNRRALMDIGVSGPLAGFVVSVFAMVVGMGLSQKVPLASLEAGMEGFELGRSMLSIILERMIIGDLPDGYMLYDHPIFVAGWVGLFVTAINLLPIGQFDGGHIVYAIFGRWHYMVSKGCVLLLVAFWALGPPYDWLISGNLVSDWWSSRFPGWLVWVFLAMMLGRKHPPPSDPYLELDRRRIFVGLLSLGIFMLCFVPIPIKIVSH
jgi:membrane-associated protease RseP (regulator of RpoE activity)